MLFVADLGNIFPLEYKEVFQWKGRFRAEAAEAYAADLSL
jgi:hypothetical protein